MTLPHPAPLPSGDPLANPFTPGFGHAPVILAGRTAALEEFAAALGGELPEQRAMLITGARGIGKTVLLSEFEARAREAGWLILTLHTGSSSLAEELRGIAVARLRELDPDAVTSRISGAGASGLSASRTVTERYAQEREPLGDLLDRLAQLAEQSGRGVLITLDEVQSVDRDQLHEVSQHLQDLIGHHARVLFVGAGVRAGVDALLEHERTTFLRRAHRLELGPVDVGTAAEAIRMTVAATSRSITPEAAVRAGEISEGYPYLIQLVGSKAWRAGAGEDVIEVEDVQGVRESVIGDMIRNVHGPALRGLSPRKHDYLLAMAVDNGPSRVGDLAERLGVDPRYQSTYRARLIEDELIESAGRGLVRFALPYLREAVLRRRDDGGPETDEGLDASRRAQQVADLTPSAAARAQRGTESAPREH